MRTMQTVCLHPEQHGVRFHRADSRIALECRRSNTAPNTVLAGLRGVPQAAVDAWERDPQATSDDQQAQFVAPEDYPSLPAATSADADRLFGVLTTRGERYEVTLRLDPSKGRLDERRSIISALGGQVATIDDPQTARVQLVVPSDGAAMSVYDTVGQITDDNDLWSDEDGEGQLEFEVTGYGPPIQR